MSRYDILKRGTDVVVAGIAIAVTSPVQIVVAALVALRLGRPVLFRQSRTGLGGTEFELLKFRTMHAPDPARGRITDADRLTPLGARLRRWSLDELPSMWNVLRGDMSLVGPRPLPSEYLERYSAEQAHRHDVRPGVTGLAQIRGRNDQSWDDKFAADAEYVRLRSLRLDLVILARTPRAVLSGAGTQTAEGPAIHSRAEAV